MIHDELPLGYRNLFKMRARGVQVMCELTTWHTGRTMERTNVRMLILVFFPDRAKMRRAVNTVAQGGQKALSHGTCMWYLRRTFSCDCRDHRKNHVHPLYCRATTSIKISWMCWNGRNSPLFQARSVNRFDNSM